MSRLLLLGTGGHTPLDGKRGGGSLSGLFDGTTGFTDFSENAVGAGLPEGWSDVSGWANTWEILDAEDAGNDCPLPGQILLAHPDTEIRSPVGIAWDAVAAPGGEDGEVLALVRHLSTDGNNNGLAPGLAVQPSGSGPMATGFGLHSAFFTGGWRWVPQLGQWYSSSTLPRIALGQWAWVRFQRLGGNVKGKWWLTTDPEPGTWRSEASMSDLPTGGQPGLLIRSMMASEQGWACGYFAFTVDPSGSPIDPPA